MFLILKPNLQQIIQPPTWTWNSNADVDEYEIFLNGVSQGTSNLTFFKSSILDDGTHEG